MRPWLVQVMAVISRQTPAYRAARLTRFSLTAQRGERPQAMRTRQAPVAATRSMGPGRGTVLRMAIFALVAFIGGLTVQQWSMNVELPPRPTGPASLRIGVVDGNPGWSGFDRDLAKVLTQDLGAIPEYVALTTDFNLPTPDRRLDLVIAQVAMTDTRNSVVTFVGPYLTGSYGVLVRAADAGQYETPTALRGKAVCATPGTGPRLRFVLKIEVLDEAPAEHCRTSLDEGAVQAVVADQLTLLRLAADHPGIYATPRVDFISEVSYGVAIATGDRDRCQRLVESLRMVLVDGRWDELFRKHFPGADPAGYKPRPSTVTGCD